MRCFIARPGLSGVVIREGARAGALRSVLRCGAVCAISFVCGLLAEAQSAATPDVPIKAADPAAISATPPVRNWFRPIREPAVDHVPDATLKRSKGGDPKRPAAGQAVPVRRVGQGNAKRPNSPFGQPIQSRPQPVAQAGAGQGANPAGPPTFAQRQAQPGGTRTIPRTPTPPIPGRGQDAAPMGDEGLVIVDPGADPATPQSRAVMLYYPDRELKYVIEAIAEHLQINIDFGDDVATKRVNLITNQPIPSESLMFVLESILGARDLQIVPTADGSLYRVTRAADAREHVGVVINPERDPDGYEALSTNIIQLSHADAGEIVPLLQNVGSSDAQIDAYGQTNTLIVTDTANGIRNMLDIIEAIDISGYSESLEYFPLEYSSAEVIAAQIQEVLTGEGGAATPQQPGAQIVRQQAQITRGRAPIPGQRPSPVVTFAEQTLRIVADERLNMLMVVASEPLMDQVRDLITRLDTPTSPDSNNMHVYRLLYADAEEVQASIAEMIGAAPPASAGDAQGGGAGSTAVQAFEKDVSVTLYDKLNALLIVASPQDYRALQAFITQIDIQTLQVFVKAIIMEVTISDRFELAVETAGLTANDAFTLNNVVSLANVLTGGPLAATGPGLNFGILDGTTDISISDGAGGIVKQTIPNVPLLLSMLETLTALDVLSEPSLTTEDNTEARITIGEQVPFITSRQSGLQQNAQNSSVFSQIQREEVGIKMTVTPQISAGDTVSLELSVEVSQTVVSSVGLDPNLVGPTVSLAIVENQMVVRDGGTAIMGGLISDSVSRSKSQTPFFGDLPLLGWLFRAKTDSRSKRNLVVLITPHILPDGIDAERVAKSETRAWRDSNHDVVYERGFIKKIKQKHHLRTKHRPSAEPTRKILGEE